MARNDRLREWFAAHGYVRVPNPEKRAVRRRGYRKGWEVRISVRDEDELEQLRSLISAAGFRPARPFVKARRICQPIYGRRSVEWFQAQAGDAEPGPGSRPADG